MSAVEAVQDGGAQQKDRCRRGTAQEDGKGVVTADTFVLKAVRGRAKLMVAPVKNVES